MVLRLLKSRLTYVFLIIVVIAVYLIWGIWSAKDISISVDKSVSTVEQAAILRTLQKIPQSGTGVVNGYAPTKNEMQKIANMKSTINNELHSISKFPIRDFTNSVDVQVLGPSIIKIDLSWSYSVPRLGWSLMQYSRVYSLRLEHASDGSIKGLDQSGHIIPPSQGLPWPQ